MESEYNKWQLKDKNIGNTEAYQFTKSELLDFAKEFYDTKAESLTSERDKLKRAIKSWKREEENWKEEMTQLKERIKELEYPCEGNCGMSYCDDNGCIERKRNIVSEDNLAPKN